MCESDGGSICEFDCVESVFVDSVFIGSVCISVMCKGVVDLSIAVSVIGEDNVELKEFTCLCGDEETASEWSFVEVVLGVTCW